LARISNFC